MRCTGPQAIRSGRNRHIDDREVDLGLGDVVHEVGQHIVRNIADDFDNAGIVKTGETGFRQIGVADLTARFDDTQRKRRNGVVDLRYLSSQGRVRGMAC